MWVAWLWHCGCLLETPLLHAWLCFGFWVLKAAASVSNLYGLAESSVVSEWTHCFLGQISLSSTADCCVVVRHPTDKQWRSLQHACVTCLSPGSTKDMEAHGASSASLPVLVTLICVGEDLSQGCLSIPPWVCTCGVLGGSTSETPGNSARMGIGQCLERGCLKPMPICHPEENEHYPSAGPFETRGRFAVSISDYPSLGSIAA